jgi:PEP-CTERM motif-containing protein
MLKNLVVLVVVLALAGSASAAVLASYELSEVGDLTVATNNNNDVVAATPVLASSVGLTATDGDHILQVDMTAADGKIEFDHTWATSTFSTVGQSAILFDLYIPVGGVSTSSVMGYWDHVLGWAGNWAPTLVQGQWQTINCNIGDPLVQASGLTAIWALVLEGMSPAPDPGTVYIDNLRTIPEPATMVLLGLGGLLLRRKK